MTRLPEPPHPDGLDAALQHFNSTFRHRYRLPATNGRALRRDIPEIDDLLADLTLIRAGGVADASCALIARSVLSITPRFAIGLLTSSEHLTVQAPDEGDPESFVGRSVLLVNPLGGRDNWSGIARWFRTHADQGARKQQLAGLASEKRPDEATNLDLLQEAATTHGRAIVLPPDEAFSAARAAEVSYVYDVPPDTLRAWKQRYRPEHAARRPGRPPRNR